MQGEAKRVGLLALAKNPAVLRDPEAMIIVEELGESTINLRFFAWIDQTKHDFLKARSQSIRLVKEAFDESGIEMPEPIYRVVLRRPGDESTAERSVAPPSVANRANAREIPPEDLSADDTIDKQMMEEQRLSREENLLPEPTAAK